MTLRYALVALLLVPTTAFAQNAVDEAKAHLSRNAFRYELAPTDLAEVSVSDAYTSRRSGTTHVYLRQRLGGIEIAGANFTVNVGRDGRVFHTAGRFVPNLAERRVAATPALTAEAAVRALAQDVGLTPTAPFRVLSHAGGADQSMMLSDAGISLEPIPARLIYHQHENGTLVLAWKVGLYEPSAQHYWVGHVDALTGAVLARYDRVDHDTFGPDAVRPASLAPVRLDTPEPILAPFAQAAPAGGSEYRVYAIPVESPNHTSPAPPADARTLESDPADPTASPFGWHDTDGIAGAEHTITRGNNVWAYTDVDANNSPDVDGSPDGGASLSFDFPLDLNQAPSTYRPAAVTNLFYWNNIIHDLAFLYGFDEASGNFQETNYTALGFGNDAVRAEAQDGSGTNNANFYTPPDGGCGPLGCLPRMQMYVGTNPTPDVDGDFDNGVIAHEFSHGISNRLTGGPTDVDCLDNAEQMGEGWSDYLGLIMTMEPGDDGAEARGTGTYLFGQPPDGPGIRLAPYSTDFAINDYTYGDTQTMFFVHQIGFVWATAIWEVTWEMIGDYGFEPDLYNITSPAGNVVMMQLVQEGMKLQPCSPGFVDGRDAILAADVSLYGGIHLETLWRGFARRGLGIGADQGSSNIMSDNMESFIEPEEVPPSPVTDLAASPDGSFATLTWTATGDDGMSGTAASYDIRYSTTGPIVTEGDFDAATQVTGEPAPQASGSPESFEVHGLDFTTTYHFALKVADESFNISDLSNPASTTTLDPPVATYSDASFSVGVLPGDTDTRTLTIGNTGPSTLSYAISLTETTTGGRKPPEVRGGGITPPTEPEPEVKGAPERTGPVAERGQGGPDDFGYRWIDSDEPGGPVYTFTDIAATGTAVSLSDDGEADVSLPFTFEFYGVPYTSFRLSANGVLSFTETGDLPYTNEPIPDAGSPNTIVAPFWDDLYPPASGAQIDHQDMGDGRFIIQWTDVPRFVDRNTPGTGNTFQMVLNQGGAIEYYYEEFNAGDLTSATVGIENQSGDDGLQIVYNNTYVHEDLAVRISALWVEATPTSGTVASGGNASVDLFFDSAGLAEGTYTADLTVTTNEPNAQVVIPITFVVDSSIPVELVSFEAAQDGGDVVLHWQTASESNNAGFDVQHLAPEAEDWALLAFVDGHGTTTEARTYSYRAADLPIGTHAFRLRQVDFDGAAEYSAEVEVAVGVVGTHALSAAYPNPFNPQASFTLAVARAQDVTIALYDAVGRRVALLHEGELEANRAYRFTIDGSDLSSGVYLYRVTGEGFAETRRLTLLK